MCSEWSAQACVNGGSSPFRGLAGWVAAELVEQVELSIGDGVGPGKFERRAAALPATAGERFTIL